MVKSSLKAQVNKFLESIGRFQLLTSLTGSYQGGSMAHPVLNLPLGCAIAGCFSAHFVSHIVDSSCRYLDSISSSSLHCHSHLHTCCNECPSFSVHCS